jgi:hypothetical protein
MAISTLLSFLCLLIVCVQAALLKWDKVEGVTSVIVYASKDRIFSVNAPEALSQRQFIAPVHLLDLEGIILMFEQTGNVIMYEIDNRFEYYVGMVDKLPVVKLTLNEYYIYIDSAGQDGQLQRAYLQV